MKLIELSNGKTIALNEEQENALESLQAFLEQREQKFFTLVGKGGTGKTTIIKEAIKEYPGVVGAAISNAAKKILQRALGDEYTVCTVAQLLGMKEKIDFFTGEVDFVPNYESVFEPPINNANIIIIDECSMISTTVLGYIKKAKMNSAKVIFLGDFRQLPAIDKQREPNSDSVTFDFPGAELTQRMRQAENSPIIPIIDLYGDNIEAINEQREHLLNPLLAQERTNNYDEENQCGIIFSDNPVDVINDVVKDFAKPEAQVTPYYVRAIAFRNNNKYNNAPFSIQVLNEKIRHKLWGTNAEEFVKGETVITEAPYPSKSPYLFNGDAFNVFEAKKEIRDGYRVWNLTLKDEKGLFINDVYVLAEESKFDFTNELEALRQKALNTRHGGDWMRFFELKDKFAKINYSYAINSHKAQGSTYRNVYVFEDDIFGVKLTSAKEKNQSMYVAVSRPTDKLVIVSVNYKNNVKNE